MLNEENSYFKNVVRDALDDLKRKGSATAFYKEQVDAIIKEYNGELKVKEDDGFYKIITTNFAKKEEKRGKKKTKGTD